MPTRRIFYAVAIEVVLINIVMGAIIRPWAARHATTDSGAAQDLAQAALLAS
jgi:hypothetical protein